MSRDVGAGLLTKTRPSGANLIETGNAKSFQTGTFLNLLESITVWASWSIAKQSTQQISHRAIVRAELLQCVFVESIVAEIDLGCPSPWITTRNRSRTKKTNRTNSKGTTKPLHYSARLLRKSCVRKNAPPDEGLLRCCFRLRLQAKSCGYGDRLGKTDPGAKIERGRVSLPRNFRAFQAKKNGRSGRSTKGWVCSQPPPE